MMYVIVRDMTAAGLGLNKFCYAGLVAAQKNKELLLKNFEEIKLLRIDLPSGELGIDEGALLKWRGGDFGGGGEGDLGEGGGFGGGEENKVDLGKRNGLYY
ncbi:hypothetical protein KY285_013958 [Solanum tuberosum]|nr:hypothetical protein KY285_013958 [Solanum tuberosum]